MTQTTQDKVRIFTAVSLPDHVKEEIQRWTVDNKDKLPFRNFTHKEDYHITLQFLGDTETSSINALCEALREAAVKMQQFPLSVGEAGVFGSPLRPRVLWKGVEGEIDELAGLFQHILDATTPLGYIPEDRPYRPHITIARKFDDSQKHKWNVKELPVQEKIEPWLVKDFVLYQTILGQKPMYKIIEKFDF
ncbi:RNA 2',3'-cyclic phosphodiesterase [Paenibacillus gallinarum]|uniref:RNA 2',3'-cyclic phosphodiesterase n=1 Tax=Paenibacillus gallinarum TaxID=2762232 RepID=A0ABR8SSZ4_9BACL|nr:RNA 2',3'-cyclic phosphodiesterase [Paenibacillus gallinarum]MBD7966478.1 RNA 2',3'-cyclic phosphodiesterase [Paenibacillus gallinarum]